MATLADLIAQREALEEARYSGQQGVRAGNVDLQFKSDADMERALAALNRKIAAASAPSPSPFVTFTTSKGR